MHGSAHVAGPGGFRQHGATREHFQEPHALARELGTLGPRHAQRTHRPLALIRSMLGLPAARGPGGGLRGKGSAVTAGLPGGTKSLWQGPRDTRRPPTLGIYLPGATPSTTSPSLPTLAAQPLCCPPRPAVSPPRRARRRSRPPARRSSRRSASTRSSRRDPSSVGFRAPSRWRTLHWMSQVNCVAPAFCTKVMRPPAPLAARRSRPRSNAHTHERVRQREETRAVKGGAVRGPTKASEQHLRRLGVDVLARVAPSTLVHHLPPARPGELIKDGGEPRGPRRLPSEPAGEILRCSAWPR